jgi:hypothetical protein
MFFYTQQSIAQVQSVTAASGGDLTGQNINVSFTIGESVIPTLKKPDMMVTQGFHQSKLSVTATGVLKELALNVEAYPNPVADEIKLVMDKKLLPGTSYSLIDMQGGLIAQDKPEGLVTKISFRSLVPAVYFLKVNQWGTTIKTFKIIKE